MGADDDDDDDESQNTNRKSSMNIPCRPATWTLSRLTARRGFDEIVNMNRGEAGQENC